MRPFVAARWLRGDDSVCTIEDHGFAPKAALHFVFGPQSLPLGLARLTRRRRASAWTHEGPDRRRMLGWAMSGVPAEPPEDRPWQMRDFVLIDPSGVLWPIAQEIP